MNSHFSLSTVYKESGRLVGKALNFYHRHIRGIERVSVLEGDWDILVILDACRADTFSEVNTMDGELSQIHSVGSKTGEFLVETFGDQEFSDTVYISANPNLTVCKATFHKRVRLWEDEWDDELGVVPPEAVTRRAIEEATESPHKRLIVHYMQPHIPFIGPEGRSLLSSDVVEQTNHGVKFWRQMRTSSQLSLDIKRCYRENLRISLPHVQRLIDAVDGKTVVTSDHGNEFGWFGIYGHPGGVYTPGTIVVPWFEPPYSERRSIVEGTATDGPEAQDSQIHERLAALGYK